MKKIKLGIIGLSEGNGHPYSWSAIINGYRPDLMETCPFPAIPRYLEKENFPDAAIHNAQVTHIWTQDWQLSQQIANATYIPHVVRQMEQMIPAVDGILLARDDAAHHLAMATPFLIAGLPIYIDKPLALCCAEVDLLFALQKYPGQLFSCSAFQYAKELLAMKDIQASHLFHVNGYIKGTWDKYAIHLIEPILKIIGHEQHVKVVDIRQNEQEKIVNYQFTNNLTVQIKTSPQLTYPPTLYFHSEKEIKKMIFADIFFAFKTALATFIEGIITKKELTQKEFVRRCVEMLEMGC